LWPKYGLSLIRAAAARRLRRQSQKFDVLSFTGGEVIDYEYRALARPVEPTGLAVGSVQRTRTKLCRARNARGKF
jgi:hypothetical protein